jgi:hypothetical protein
MNFILLSTKVGLVEFGIENQEAKSLMMYSVFAGKNITLY